MENVLIIRYALFTVVVLLNIVFGEISSLDCNFVSTLHPYLFKKINTCSFCLPVQSTC